MMDTEWWNQLKEGDRIFWGYGKCRYEAKVMSRATPHSSLVVKPLYAEVQQGDSLQFDSETNLPEKLAFSTDMLRDTDVVWAYEKTTDVTIYVRLQNDTRMVHTVGDT